MADPSLRDRLTELAKAAGFDVAGMVALPAGERSNYVEEWIAAGHAGEMDYLKRRNEEDQLLRSSIQTAFPWARSVVIGAVNYNAVAPRSIEPSPAGAGWIARYAWSGTLDEHGAPAGATDYHNLLIERLRKLEGQLQEWLGFEQSRSYVDTGPVIERAYASLAGIGWTGKNTCIIHQELGSWLFLGVIVTSYDISSYGGMADGLTPSEEVPVLAPDRCGTCRRCIEACPTDALIAPYAMDASRCIAYLTIEKRGPIDPALRSQMGRQIFGCDICQDVCPWNRRAPVTQHPEFAARPELINPRLSQLAELDAQSFNKLFKGSPVKRTKIKGLKRNVAIAMGNSGDAQYLQTLGEWAEQAEDPVLREAAEWSTRQIRNARERAAEESSTEEKGPPVQERPPFKAVT